MWRRIVNVIARLSDGLVELVAESLDEIRSLLYVLVRCSLADQHNVDECPLVDRNRNALIAVNERRPTKNLADTAAPNVIDLMGHACTPPLGLLGGLQW